MVELIFVVLVLSAVWAAILLLELPSWIAILSTVAVVLIVAAVFVFRAVRARRGARAIEAALRSQAEQAVAGARPDRQADIEAMKAELLQGSVSGPLMSACAAAWAKDEFFGRGVRWLGRCGQ